MSDTHANTTDSNESDTEPAEVLDPEDFNQSRRLKTIHDARDNVRDALEDVTVGKARPDEHTTTRSKLSQAVAAYGHELLPLMDKADWTHEFDDDFPADSVRHFITAMGDKRVLDPENDSDYFPVYVPMMVYGKLNHFMAEHGLGADLDDENDEWEV